MGSLHEFSFDQVIVRLLIVRYESYVLIELGKLWWKDIRRKQLLGLDLVFVVHHLLEALLVRLVSPWKLTNAKVAQEVEKGLNIILFKIFLIRDMSCQCSIHGSSNNSKIVLFLCHVLFQGLCGSFLLSSFRVNDVFLLLLHHYFTACFWIYNWWVCATFLLGETKVDEVDKVSL